MPLNNFTLYSRQVNSNEYDFTLKGFKMVPELGIFLKEEDRRLSY